MGALVAAALLLIGVRLAVREDTVAQGPAQTVATVETLSGAARVISSARGGEPALIQIGDAVREGDAVDTTGGGLVARRWGGQRYSASAGFRLCNDAG